MSNNKKLANLLNVALRHNPNIIGLCLDKDGYTTVSQVLKCLIYYGENIDLETLTNIVENDFRFEFDEYRVLIRGVRQASISMEKEYSKQEPPYYLYVNPNHDAIRDVLTEGLRRNKNKDFVVLEEKFKGKKRGAIYCINARDMHNDGFEFFKSKSGKWATEYVPRHYLTLATIK